MSRFCPGEVFTPSYAKVPIYPLPYSVGQGGEDGRKVETPCSLPLAGLGLATANLML